MFDIIFKSWLLTYIEERHFFFSNHLHTHGLYYYISECQSTLNIERFQTSTAYTIKCYGVLDFIKYCIENKNNSNDNE